MSSRSSVAELHLQPTTTVSPAKAQILTKRPDVVIVSSIRTAITKASKGPLKDTYPKHLSHVVRAAYTSIHLDPKLIHAISVDTHWAILALVEFIAKQYGARMSLTSVYIGSGMGMAAVFVSEQ